MIMKKKKNSSSIQEALKNLRMAIRASFKKKKKKRESYMPAWHNRTYSPAPPVVSSPVETSFVAPPVRQEEKPTIDYELEAIRAKDREENRLRLERYKRQDEELARRIDDHRRMIRTGGDPYGG